MKTPKDWLESFQVRYEPRGKALYELSEADISAIQAEALEHALFLVENFSAIGHNPVIEPIRAELTSGIARLKK